jgi:hypothetical protein
MREKLLLVCGKNIYCGIILENSLIAHKKGEMCGVGYCMKYTERNIQAVYHSIANKPWGGGIHGLDM